MKRTSIFVFFILSIFTLVAQSHKVTAEQEGCGTIKDTDGNSYKTVMIGTQCWMAENMRTMHDRNGKEIISDYAMAEITPMCYSPNNNYDNVSKYGYLYNYEAAMNVCPLGWHLPNNEEFHVLMDYCSKHYSLGEGGKNIAKSMAATTGWKVSSEKCAVGNNPSENNLSGFSALPAGYYANDFSDFNAKAYFWSATDNGAECGFYLCLNYYDSTAVLYNSGLRKYGRSVRCIRYNW